MNNVSHSIKHARAGVKPDTKCRLWWSRKEEGKRGDEMMDHECAIVDLARASVNGDDLEL